MTKEVADPDTVEVPDDAEMESEEQEIPGIEVSECNETAN